MKPIGRLASAFFFTRHVSQTVRHNHHFEFNLDRSLFKFDLLRLPSFAGTQLPRAIRDCYRDFWRARLSPRLFVVFTTFLSRPVKISQSRVLQYSRSSLILLHSYLKHLTILASGDLFLMMQIDVILPSYPSASLTLGL